MADTPRTTRPRRVEPSRLVPRTVRGRSAAAAALAMALLLTVGGVWLHSLLRANLLENANGRTELAARKVAAQADTGTLPARLPASEGGVDLVVVVDARGHVVAATRDTAPDDVPALTGFRPPPGEDSATRILPGGERSDLVVIRATTPGGEARYVYGMTVLSDVDAATGAIGWVLLATTPPLIVLAAALAWAVTGAAMRPVGAIRTELDAVTARDLDRRVPEPPGGDEIALLARTVNTTLDRLEQSVGQQRRFVADASHELRGPIAAVRSRLEVALADPGEAAVRAALADTERLQQVASDLLLLARLDARPVVRNEPVDLALLAAEDAARRGAARAPLVVDADTPVPVRGDPAQLERLLANLVDNALRHAAGEVRVRAALEHATPVLEVTDDGPGIPPAARAYVFERFARLDAARTRDSGGTGLGLAIARDIARAHGGDLVVADSPRGARLVATLPGCAVQEPRRS
ncbi:sensor histidine kinase [Streptomyces sp. NBC_01268]|uniref:sensor histidine kinase n=1 Tax=Streptomyces sp. NBC_01268 TaxID=2903806 RepID=UPI002E313ABF|nr:HAMP domain-containing sensor histidine kinase [Streptomyces sp. NBC_01268]